MEGEDNFSLDFYAERSAAFYYSERSFYSYTESKYSAWSL